MMQFTCYPFNMNEMASSLSSAAILRAKNTLEKVNLPLTLSKESALISQTKHILMNVVKYFENEAKKSKSHPTIIDKITKATGKTGCVMKTIHKLACSWLVIFMNWLAKYARDY